MKDLLFKMYFSFFIERGEKGAEAAIVVLVWPVTFTIYISFLFVLSYFVRVSDLGPTLFVMGIVLLAVLVQYYFRRTYIIQRRFELIKISNRGAFAMLGILYFLFLLIMFPIIGFVLLSDE